MQTRQQATTLTERLKGLLKEYTNSAEATFVSLQSNFTILESSRANADKEEKLAVYQGVHVSLSFFLFR